MKNNPRDGPPLPPSLPCGGWPPLLAISALWASALSAVRVSQCLSQGLACSGLLVTIPPALAFPRALANLYEDPEWSQKDLAGPIV